jgi:hypothetical protein
VVCGSGLIITVIVGLLIRKNRIKKR